MAHLYEFGVVRNLIDTESRILHDSLGSWTPGAGNTLWRCTGLDYGSIADSSLGVHSNGLQRASTSLTGIAVPNTVRTIPVRFHVLARISGSKTAQINIELTVFGPGQGTWRLDTTTGDLSGGQMLRPGDWQLFTISTEVPENFAPSDSEPTSVTVTVAANWEIGNTDQNLFLLYPSLTAPNTVTDNIAAVETFIRLPEYMRDTDAEQVEPDYPLLRFIDVLFAVAGDVDRTWADFRYVPAGDTSSRQEKKSVLADPALISLDRVSWLAQLLGVALIDPRVGVTSWGSLMDSADALPPDGSGDGNRSPSWGEWVQAVDTNGQVLYDHDDDPGTPDVLTNLMQWDEIEDFDIDGSRITPEALLDFLRWQVTTAVYGFRGGTSDSLVIAARRGLKSIAVDGDGVPIAPTVDIQRHFGGDPWKIRVGVNSETLIDGSITTIQELLDPATPAGFEVEAFLLL